MSLDTSAVRRALVEVLGAIDGRVLTYTTPPKTPRLPSVVVYPPDSINYMVARDTDLAVYPVLVLVGPQDPTGIELLEGFMAGTGPLSIRAALYADRSLGGTVSNTKLLDMTSGAYQIGTGPDDNAIGAEFRVEITA